MLRICQDVTANAGFVSLGIRGDTAESAGSRSAAGSSAWAASAILKQLS